jgi:hypothetical protein
LFSPVDTFQHEICVVLDTFISTLDKDQGEGWVKEAYPG